MQNNTTPSQRILETGVMAAARIPSAKAAVEVTEALAKGGVNVIEFSMNMPDALEAIAAVAKKNYEHISVGVGTVLDIESAQAAIKAGAEFIVAPTTNEGVAEIAHRYEKPFIPGALTPNEILRAFELGAAIVKVFPGGNLGAEYIRAVLAPFGHIPLMPDGGVTLENAEELISAGAAALGVGSCLVDTAAIEAGDYGKLTALAKGFTAAVKSGRGK
jgi:2-dehydro-3-deoxyphosphogluconate aldolase/(4S)-4-hydroxy-2-oxoglutarate aldolase